LRSLSRNDIVGFKVVEWGRSLPGSEYLIGYFALAMQLALRVSTGDNVESLLDRVADRVLTMMEHAIPLWAIAYIFDSKRWQSGLNGPRITFDYYLDNEIPRLQMPGIIATRVNYNRRNSFLGLPVVRVTMERAGEGAEVHLDYVTNAHDAQVMIEILRVMVDSVRGWVTSLETKEGSGMGDGSLA
jgi:hypothetical protein